LPEDSYPGDSRNGLLEQLQAFGDCLRGEEGQPRDVAARARKAGDKPAPNRIGGSSEDDGDRPGRVLGCERRRRALANEDVNLEANQLSRQGGKPFELPLGRSVLDEDVLVLDVIEITEPLAEGLWEVGVRGSPPGSLFERPFAAPRR